MVNKIEINFTNFIIELIVLVLPKVTHLVFSAIEFFNLRMQYFLSILLIICAVSVQGQDKTMSDRIAQIQAYHEQGKHILVLKAILDFEQFLNSDIADSGNASDAMLNLYQYAPELSHITSAPDLTDYELGRAYEIYGTKLFQEQKYSEAEKYYLESEKHISSLQQAISLYRWLGTLYGLTQESHKSIEYYYKSKEAIQKKYSPESKVFKEELIVLYVNIQHTLIEFGNFKEAQQNCRTAIRYAESLNQPYYITASYINQAYLYYSKNQPENMLLTLEKLEPYIHEQKQLIQYYNDLMALSYSMKEDYENAIIYFNKSINAMPDKTVSNVTRLISQAAVAGMHEKLKRHEESINIISDVIAGFERNSKGFESYLADAYTLRAQSHLAQNNIKSAYADIQSALASDGEFEIWKVKHHSYLTKVYSAYYKQNKSTAYADSIYWNIKTTDNLIDSIRNANRYLEGEIGLNTFLHEVYTNHLDALFELYQVDNSSVDFEDVFKYFEKIKSYVHKEYLKTDDAVKEGMLPDEKLREERIIKNELATLKKQLKLKQKQNLTEKEEAELNAQISETENDYSQFLEQLEVDYPNYYTFQVKQYETNLDAVQKELASTEAIIEYYVNTTHLYILAITKSGCTFYKKEKNDNWKESVNNFLDILTTSPQNSDRSDQLQYFTNTAHQLYNFLLGDVIPTLPNSVKHLIIIGDNELNFLPFGVLAEEPFNQTQTFNSIPYLLHKYSISYDVSVSSYMESKIIKRKNHSLNYIGFSPLYEDQNKDLPYTRAKIEEISDMYNGKSIVNQKIQVNDILKHSKGAQILHFGMHGEIDKWNPSLSHLVLSSDEKEQFYVSDIYGTNFDAALLVLSACNTGTGKYLKGEGVQNISRAFRFAGIPSTTMSLWSLPDVQTSQIEYNFFENLNTSHRKDEALQKAKLRYLSTAPKALTHPFYWAGVIPIGNMEPISFTSPHLLKYGFLMVFSLLLIIGLVYFKKKED